MEMKKPAQEMTMSTRLGIRCITKPPQRARMMPPTASGVNQAAVWRGDV